MLPEGQQLSHYQLVRLLKSGGMGEVYLAVDTLLHRQVAIKVIHTDFMHDAEYGAAEEAMRLFLREAQAIAQLDQINILPLYDSGKEHINQALLMYMVMPYRYLGSLKDWLQAHQEQEPLPLAAVERIVTQAAFALQHAHDRQIIHQDVKPSNFLVHGDAEHPSRLNLQLADFGVAKFMMKTSEKSLIVRGTPNYMAPEQWEGQPVPATDQYALAVMAYELLTGRLPFEGNGYQNMWHQHCYVEPTPPSMINPVLPKELDGVLLRALAKKLEHRYSSVSAFAQAFTRAVVNSGNVYQTHVISVLEAQNGTNRVLILPNGKQVTLPIPPGAYNGQVIRLEGYGKPTTYNGTLGALILTIVVAEVDAGVSPADVTVQQKFPTPVMQSEISPTLPAVSSRRGQVRGSAILKMCLALVLLLGMASLFYFSVSRAISPMKGNTTATAVYATQAAATTTEVACPSYLPGCGTLALYDPLRDDSKGYDWHPPDYSGCDFLGGALHVSVNGDNTHPVHFHVCIGRTPRFSDFAYEVKMTFINGDCGGVVFRSGDPQYDPRLYYFYICQDGQYGLVRYTENVLDSTINPMLTEGRSSYIVAGSGQVNVIAVVALGPKFELYVNKQYINEVQDPNPGYYRDGTIGVVAKALDLYRPTEVAFSDARVWTF
jgi:serine/threonine protein kinase